MLFVRFYVRYSLVLVELFLHVPADQAAIEAGHARDVTNLGLLREEQQKAGYATETKLQRLSAKVCIYIELDQIV